MKEKYECEWINTVSLYFRIWLNYNWVPLFSVQVILALYFFLNLVLEFQN